MPTTLCLTLTALLMLGVVPLAHSQQHTDPKAKASQQEAKPDARGTQDSPLVVKVLDPDNAEERATQAAEERDQKASIDQTLVRLNRWLVLAALVQAALFVGQLYMMWQAHDTTKRQLRAYMSRTGKPEWRELIQPDQSKVYEFMVPVINSGQTPAYHVTARGRAMFYQKPLPKGADLTLPPAPDASSGLVGPGEQISATCISEPLDLTPLKWMFERRDWTLYLVGEVTYTDAFRGRHALRFCEGVDWSYAHTVLPGIPTFPVERHNDGD